MRSSLVSCIGVSERALRAGFKRSMGPYRSLALSCFHYNAPLAYTRGGLPACMQCECRCTETRARFGASPWPSRVPRRRCTSAFPTLTRIISEQFVALFSLLELLAPSFFPLLLSNIERKRGKKNDARSSVKKNLMYTHRESSPRSIISDVIRKQRFSTFPFVLYFLLRKLYFPSLFHFFI